MRVEIKNTDDYIVELSKRIDRLEAGGKPMASLSPVGSVTVSLGANGFEDDLAATLSWSNPDVLAIPKGIPAFSIYVDQDANEDYAYPYGNSLSTGQKNLEFTHFINANFISGNQNKTRVTFSLRNRDGSSHTYYVYVRWVYLAGGSGAGV